MRKYHNCLVRSVTGRSWDWEATAAMPSLLYPGFKRAPEALYVSPQNTSRFKEAAEEGRRALSTTLPHFCLRSYLSLSEIINVALQQLCPPNGCLNRVSKYKTGTKIKRAER